MAVVRCDVGIEERGEFVGWGGEEEEEVILRCSGGTE